MKFDPTKEAAIELAQTAVKRGASAAEVIIKKRTEFAVGVRLGEVEKLKQSIDQGLGLRVLIEGRQASVSGSDFSRSSVLALLDEAIELARATSPDDSMTCPNLQSLPGQSRTLIYTTMQSKRSRRKRRSIWP